MPEDKDTNEQTAAQAVPLTWRGTVTLDHESDELFHRIVNPGLAARESAAFWMRNIFGYGGLALGAYAAFTHEMMFIGCMIVTIGVALFRQHRVVAPSQTLGLANTLPPMVVEFEITEKGISETDRGVVSNFEWHVIYQWFLCEGLLLLKLKNGKWAILPSKSAKPDLPVDRLISFMKDKGIPGRVVSV
jgi:hypothetical protein